MKPQKVILIPTVLLLPFTGFAATPVEEIVKHIPGESAFVVVIPNFEHLVSELAAFGEAACLDDLAKLDAAEMMKGPLDGHVDGLDWRGAFAVTMQPGQRKPVLVGTLLDPDAWKSGMAAEAVGGDIFKVQMHGETWYAASVGNVGVLATKEEAVRVCLTPGDQFSRRFDPQGAAMLKRHQVTLWADVESWQPMLDPLVTVAQGFMQMSLAMSDPEAEGNLALWQWLFDQTRTLIREADVYAAGFTFSDRGAFARDLLTLEPGGEIAEYLKKIGDSEKDLLRGLYSDPGMITFAAEWKVPPEVKTFSEAALDAMLATPRAAELVEGDDAEAGIEASRALYRAISGYNMTARLREDGRITISGMYLTEQPEGTLTLLKKSIDSIVSAKLMTLFSTKLEIDLAHRSERIGSHNIDAYTMTFKTEDEQMRKALRAIYGERIHYYVAPSEGGLAFAMGASESGREAITRILDSNAESLARDKRIMTARRAIAPKPDMCVLLDLNGLALFGMKVWQSMGEGPAPPIDLSVGQSPLIAFGIYLNGASMRSEVFVPADSVRQVVEAIEKHKERQHGEPVARGGHGRDNR